MSSDLKFVSCPIRTILSFKLTDKAYIIYCCLSLYLKSFHVVTSQNKKQKKLNRVSFFSTKRASYIVFNTYLHLSLISFVPFWSGTIQVIVPGFFCVCVVFKKLIFQLIIFFIWSSTFHKILVYQHPVLVHRRKGVHPFVYCKWL